MLLHQVFLQTASQNRSFYRAVDQYKERARRLEQESKNQEGEVENAKQLVKQKEEESRSKDKAIEEAKEVSYVT